MSIRYRAHSLKCFVPRWLCTVRGWQTPASTGRPLRVRLHFVMGRLVHMPLIGSARRSLGATLEMALPTSCGGCGGPGATWCYACAAEACHSTYPEGGRQVSPTPCPRGYPPTWAVSPYDGTTRKAVVAYKDGDRRDLVAVLAPMLAEAVAAAMAGDPHLRAVLASGNGPVFVVPVPSSRGRTAGSVGPCRSSRGGSLVPRPHRVTGAEAPAQGGRPGRTRPQTTGQQCRVRDAGASPMADQHRRGRVSARGRCADHGGDPRGGRPRPTCRGCRPHRRGPGCGDPATRYTALSSAPVCHSHLHS